MSPSVALPELSAVTLAARIASGDLSPLELLDACIARIEAYNPAVNAICATDFDRAREQARAAGDAATQARKSGAALPLLHGLPIGVKDLQDTAGLLTTYGNVGRRNFVPTRDISAVARVRAAGGIVAAKTNVPDMGLGGNSRNPVWGATGNPFAPMKNAGGSSGGSAAALATDMLPLCTGSDTGGSLRIPAALNGVVGLRPSPGIIAYDSRPLGWSALSVLGPMGRTVDDTALLFAAMAGMDGHDPLAYPVDTDSLYPVRSGMLGNAHGKGVFGLGAAEHLSKLRIGYTEDFGACAVDPDIRATLRARLAALQGHVASITPWEAAFPDAHRAFDILRAESAVAAFADIARTAPDTLGPNALANLEIAKGISLVDRAWAHLEQTRIARAFSAALDQFDLVLAPVTPVSPFPWANLFADVIDGQRQENYYRWLSLTYVPTLATNPALSLPCGLDSPGMPFGLQVIGRLRGDAQLLTHAKALETLFAASPDTARPRPDFSKLAAPVPALKSIVTHPPGHGDVSASAAAMRPAV
jgi:amidase